MDCVHCQIEMHLTEKPETKKLWYICNTCGWENPANHLKIDKMYAFISVDPKDNNEGVVGMPGPDDTLMPMVGADKNRMDFLRPFARMIADRAGIKIELREFSSVKVLETYER